MFKRAIILAALLASTAALAQAPSEWLTFGYDAQRSGWNRAEDKIGRAHV